MENSTQIKRMREKTHPKNLSQTHIRMIDDAISAVGEFGEIHLIVEKGCLRFVIVQKSYDALKYRPGEIATAL
jgi:hypothetical protein